MIMSSLHTLQEFLIMSGAWMVYYNSQIPTAQLMAYNLLCCVREISGTDCFPEPKVVCSQQTFTSVSPPKHLLFAANKLHCGINFDIYIYTYCR